MAAELWYAKRILVKVWCYTGDIIGNNRCGVNGREARHHAVACYNARRRFQACCHHHGDWSKELVSGRVSAVRFKLGVLDQAFEN